jgi:pyruvate kinase
VSAGQRLRRTKIVATLGPATDDPAMIDRLVAVGVDCFRLNFSHGSLEDHETRIRNVRAAQERFGRPLALLADLQGPKLRVGKLPEPVLLEAGSDVTLAGRGDATPGDLELGFPLDLAAQLRRGSEVLIDDGLVRLRVAETEDRRVRCNVEMGGTVTSNKGVNLPRTYLPIPSITDDDRDNLEFAIDHDVDYVALSFVRRAEDVEDLKKLLAARKARARAIAKIEKAEAIENLEGIVAVADGLMVARGDLGVEIGAADVPLAQKRIIRLGLEAGKPVITATQMLESMISRPEPTRAEASDVANAILDGTGAVMLSGETAVGQYPLEAVQTMVRIALAVEPHLSFHDVQYGLTRLGARYIADVVGHAACDIAETLGVAAIIVPTVSGESAREVSKHRPRRPVVGASPDQGVLQQLALDWAVVPLQLEPSTTVEEQWSKAIEAVSRVGLAGPGDRVVITSGTRMNRPGSTNTILVQAL